MADIEVGMSADGREGFVSSSKAPRLREAMIGEGLSGAFNLEITVRYSGKETNENKVRGLVAVQLVDIADSIKERFVQALQFDRVVSEAEKRAAKDQGE